MTVSSCLQEVGNWGCGQEEAPGSPHMENKPLTSLVWKTEGLNSMSLSNQQDLEPGDLTIS